MPSFHVHDYERWSSFDGSYGLLCIYCGYFTELYSPDDSHLVQAAIDDIKEWFAHGIHTH